MNRAPLDRSRLDRAKELVPLSVAAAALGLQLRPNGSQPSPLRPDRSPSFSVTGDRLWHDFSTGEGGDVVSFLRAALACSNAEAIKRLLALAGLDSAAHLPPLRIAPRPPAPPPAPKRDALAGLKLERATIPELAQVRLLRKWPLWAGLEIAFDRGMFYCADVSHLGETHRAWVFTDAARLTAYARRLDGLPWQGKDRPFKSLHLREEPDAPAGLADVVTANRPAVLLCEGEVDALAAILAAWLAGIAERVGVIRLSGNVRAVTPAVAAALAGRRVRIVRQCDAPRANGNRPAHGFAASWSESLRAAGIAHDVANLDAARPAGRTGDFDLADALAGHDEETAANFSAQLTQNLDLKCS